jgi:hypothetical protein
MSGDFTEGMTPEEREGWEEYVEHFRRDTLQKMDSSAYVMSMVPRGGFDVKFATELGAAIMLGKPIFAVAMPGAEVADKLVQVADQIVYADVDTEAGQREIARALHEFMQRRL